LSIGRHIHAPTFVTMSAAARCEDYNTYFASLAFWPAAPPVREPRKQCV
jgi:hypothetical protein